MSYDTTWCDHYLFLFYMLKTLALYSFCNTFPTVLATPCLAHGL